MMVTVSAIGFMLPSESCEKIGFRTFRYRTQETQCEIVEISVLLSVCFLLTMISDILPETSESVSLLGECC